MIHSTVTKALVFPALFLLLFSCKSFYVSQTTSNRIDTSEYTALDTSVLELVEPYRTDLESSMNIVIAELANDLIKEQPECTLGNHVAGINAEAAAASMEMEIDFGLMNYGGLRVPSINKGPLMVKDAYQIMPFDNYVVVMELKGAVIAKLLNQIAALGGWPVHNLSFVIEKGEAVDVKIGGVDLDPTKSYTMATSDYLADGGDHLDILKAYSYHNTGILLRDAILDSWRATTKKGSKVEAKTDGRVSNRE